MDEKLLRGWKCIVIDGRKSFISRWGTPYNGPYIRASLHYPVQVTKTRTVGNGPLAVFKTRREARAFLARENGLIFERHELKMKIVKCLYKPSADRGLWAGDQTWREEACPNGTMFADSVCCLE